MSTEAADTQAATQSQGVVLDVASPEFNLGALTDEQLAEVDFSGVDGLLSDNDDTNATNNNNKDDQQQQSVTDDVTDDQKDPQTQEEDPNKDPEQKEVPLPEVSKEDLVKLFGTIKADGKEIKLKDIDEAISLIQKGVAFHRKSQEFAQKSKLVKVLENNGLTSQQDLNLLIDVNSGDPKAIAKFLKAKGIDPMDLPVDDGNFTPKDHSVSDKEVEFDDVVAQYQGDPEFKEITSTVTTQWDNESKRLLVTHPKILGLLTEDKKDGHFDIVMAEVNRRALLGHFDGLPVLQQYRQVTEDLAAQARAERLAKAGNPGSDKAPQPSNVDTSRQDRRKEASPTPRQQGARQVDEAGIPKGFPKSTEELLAMSDDELMNLPT